MTATPWPDHLLTLEEWDALPEDTFRHTELAEGILIRVPAPAPLHQRAMWQLIEQLEDQLPLDLTALPDVDVLLDERHPVTVRAPDVVVTSSKLVEDTRRGWMPPTCCSPSRSSHRAPGTGRTDRVTKPAEYADAGIPHYWVIELDEPSTLTAYLLVDGDYEVVAQTTGTGDRRRADARPPAVGHTRRIGDGQNPVAR